MAENSTSRKLIHTRLSIYLAVLWLITFIQNIYELKNSNNPPEFLELFICGMFYFYVFSGKKFAINIFIYTTVLDAAAMLLMLFLTFRPAPAMAFMLWKFNTPMQILLCLFTLLKIIVSYHLLFNSQLKALLSDKNIQNPNLLDKSALLAAGFFCIILIALHLFVKIFYYY